jgi:hypothetical protein
VLPLANVTVVRALTIRPVTWALEVPVGELTGADDTVESEKVAIVGVEPVVELEGETAIVSLILPM